MREDLLDRLKKRRENDAVREEVRKQRRRMEKFSESQKNVKLGWKKQVMRMSNQQWTENWREKKLARESVKEYFRIRKHQPPSPDQCPLYNCPRPHFQKRHKVNVKEEENDERRLRSRSRGRRRGERMRRKRNDGSPASIKSSVSNQSVRSRSPIVFHSSD